jgi:cytochrome c-type biogenesis protein CcmH
MKVVRIAFAAIAILSAASASIDTARAVEADEILADPVLEARARKLSAELRCLVCQNQSIDDSHAPLARDLRVIVRERLVAGDTDAQIIDFVVERYGEFVLLRPRLSWHTVLLWGAAPALLLAGGLLLWRRGRAPAEAPVAPLSAEEERALADLLNKES